LVYAYFKVDDGQGTMALVENINIISEIWKLNFGLSIKPIKSPHKFLPLDGGG